MKISELLSDKQLIAKYCNVYEEDMDILTICIDYAISKICNTTGYTKAELDNDEDLTIAFLKEVSGAYDNRSNIDFNNAKSDLVLNSIYNLHNRNVL